MRWAGIAGGVVLALAMGLWWLLRGQAPAVAFPATVAAARPPVVAAMAPASASIAGHSWTQSEQDRAWCRLPGVRYPEDRSFTAEEMAQALANDPSTQQGKAEMARLRKLWAAQLRLRDDERSQAAADLVEMSDAAKRHLFDLARNTKDPVVYGWAMAECAQRASCELSPLRWAQLDPGNLIPWKMEAQRAQKAGEEQAAREAVYQMGLARRSDDYARIVFALEYTLAQADRPGLQMSTEVFMPQSDYILRKHSTTLAGRYCSTALVKSDPTRRQICLAAAEAMWQNADDLTSAMFAISWGKSSTSDDDPAWTKRRAEIDGLQKRIIDHSDRIISPFLSRGDMCGALPEMRRYIETVSAIGELAALRQLPDTSPQ